MFLYIYGLKKGEKVIIIDDEVSTGETMRNTIKELRKKGIVVKDAACLFEFVKMNGREKIKKLGLDLKSYFKV